MAKPGPVKWVPSDEEVDRIGLLVACGMTQEQVALVIGKCVDTIANDSRGRLALDTGRLKVIGNIGGNLIQRAIAGDNTAAIFYLKTQAGWREKDDADKDVNLNVTINRLT